MSEQIDSDAYFAALGIDIEARGIGPLPDLEEITNLVHSAWEQRGDIVLRIFCRTSPRKVIGRVYSTPQGLLFEAEHPYDEATRLIVERQGHGVPIAKTAARALLDSPRASSGRYQPAVRCRHGIVTELDPAAVIAACSGVKKTLVIDHPPV